jgi:hypothetical protein
MRDEAQMLNIRARILAIEAEIEAAKFDNKIRELAGHTTFNYDINFFLQCAKQLENLSEEVYR